MPRLVLIAVLAALALVRPAAAQVAGADAATPLAGHWMTAERRAEGVSLAGQLPGESTRTVLATYAAALFGAGRVTDRTTTVAGDLPPDWVKMAMAALDALAEISDGRAELAPGSIRVTGSVEVPEEAGLLTRGLREKLPPGVRVSTEFEVAAPTAQQLRAISPERCAYLMTRIAEDRKILFESGSAEVAEESLAALGAIASIFARCPDAEIEVAGYTDSSGGASANLSLSQARAEAVMEVLQGAGVKLRQLRARGFGEADPIADNETEEGKERNRRIEFHAIE